MDRKRSKENWKKELVTAKTYTPVEILYTALALIPYSTLLGRVIVIGYR
jgi:hypothetical protein